MKSGTGKWGLVITAALAPAIGMACTPRPPSVDNEPLDQIVLRAFCASELVFIGQVSEQLRLGEYVVEHEVRPIVGFKGVTIHRNVRPKFVLTTRNSCDIDYVKGSTYLFFAQADPETGRIVPGFTVPLARSEPVRAELAKIAETPNVCSTDHAVEHVPYYLLPLEWQRELLQQLNEGRE